MLAYDRTRWLDRVILLFLLGLLFFGSPFFEWFGDVGAWFLPYVLWLVLIMLRMWLYYFERRRDL